MKNTTSKLYQAKRQKIELIKVPSMGFLQIDGLGDPNQSEAFQNAVKCLFALSYRLKFSHKKLHPQLDYKVHPLEGLWWSEDMTSFTRDDRNVWQWTMMIHQPACIDKEQIIQAIKKAQKEDSLPAVDKVRFEQFEEGICAQTLHLGPFSQEGPTIERLHEFIAQHGKRQGKHHEIYLSDMRRCKPENLRTIIRQPLLPA